jgi:hypothetical protein
MGRAKNKISHVPGVRGSGHGWVEYFAGGKPLPGFKTVQQVQENARAMQLGALTA